MEREKYICDKCGTGILLYNELPNNCPICNGKLIAESKMKEQEKLENMIGDNVDEDLTPKQDADEVIDDYIRVRMIENIVKYGNNEVWYNIENSIINAEQRIKYREFFILAGGICPKGEEIKI